MSVYPERKREKGYTGRWIAEVQSAHKKKRMYLDTFEQAQAAEEFMKGKRKTLPETEGYTLEKLSAEASHRVWRGTDDELRAGRRWLKALALLGPKTQVAHVRKDQLEALVDKLRAKGFKPGTINRYLSTVSKVLRYAHEAEKIAGMPKFPWQDEGKGRIKWLLPENTEAFLDHIVAHHGEAYAFGAATLILTGLRVHELLRLNPRQVTDDDVVLIYETKTDEPRAIPLPTGYGGLLRAWLTGSGVYYRKLLDAIAEASEAICGDRLTPHSMRHTTASRLTAAGVPTETVAKIMGHKSLATTRKYIHLEVSTLRQAVATLSPPHDRGTGDFLQSSLERNPLKSGGLGGNRTPVQGFAGLCSKKTSY